MNSLYFRVAEVGFSISCADTEQLKADIPSFAPFWLQQKPETEVFSVTIHEGCAENVEKSARELGEFDCGGTNHIIYERADGGYEICIHDLRNVLAARLQTNADFSQCKVFTASDAEARLYGLRNALMISYTFAAAKCGVVLMHSSVVFTEGRAYMFLGKSGTGKSTHSGLWLKNISGTDLLNDDNPAVRVGKSGEAVVYGTPWSGKTPCYRNLHFPIGAIVRLQQAPANEIHREPTLIAFASVLSSCSSMLWDKPSYDFIRRTVEVMALHVPVYLLKCLPDDAAAHLSHSTIINDYAAAQH